MKNTNILLITRRIEIIEFDFIIDFFFENFVIYVFFVRVHNDENENLKNVHTFKRIQINVVMQNEKNQQKKIEISKK